MLDVAAGKSDEKMLVRSTIAFPGKKLNHG